MRQAMNITGLAALLLCACALVHGAEDAALALKDLSGAERQPLKFEKDKDGQPALKAAVLIFITHECPIANAYAPEINRICGEYEKKGFAFYLVQVDPDLTLEAAKKHAKEFGYTCPVLLDPKHELVARVQAKITPEAFVVGADGKVLYRGRIDDRNLSFTKKKLEPDTKDLRAALDAVAAGKKVETPETKAIGCFIKSLEERKP